jgi:hypothetical protein
MKVVQKEAPFPNPSICGMLLLRLHYNYDNTNNELTHRMFSVLGNPTGIYKANT